MKKVWVNGTFDVVHIGHIKLLQFANTFGSVTVGLDTDERVRSKKGESRPFNTLDDRMDFISSIRFVHDVVSFGTDDELINQIKIFNPDVMVIGSEYRNKQIIGLEHVPRIEFFEKIDGYSSSKILTYGNNSNR
jgi:D-beta-D-heptose 7-phosphate kinase/D-beta-D-heptose 1-phosphate adenosyltransferase